MSRLIILVVDDDHNMTLVLALVQKPMHLWPLQ